VVAAVQHGEVDGISNADPMVTKLDKEGLIKIVADTRTLEGTTKVYGGPYPAAVLYTPSAFIEKNPNTVQALVNALVRGLKWVKDHSAEEIAKMMPEEYMLGDKPLFIAAIKANHEAYSPDGRFLKDAPETALKVLKAFDPNVQNATIDLSKTYTSKFVEAAQTGH
jgi:NitT/TauT family transport system substrate-binding protein